MPLEQRDTPYPHWQFRHAGSGDSLRVVPERGGLISGWSCDGRERLYFDDERFADPSLSVRGGMPVLFPICGGLPGNRLPLPQGEFTLPQHGFARDLPWRLSPLADDQGIALELSDSAATRAAFPFAFRLNLEARLLPQSLEITVSIEHRAGFQGVEDPGTAGLSRGGQAAEALAHDPLELKAGSMPFSFGLHPYFAVSSLGALRFEGLPPRCFDHHQMAEDATAAQLARIGEGMDLLTRPAGAVQMWDGERGIALETTLPWDLVVLWSEPPRPMVCLEPWTGPRQALLSGDRRLALAPGEQLQLRSRYVCLQAGG